MPRRRVTRRAVTAPKRVQRPPVAAIRLARELRPHGDATPGEIFDTVTGPYERHYADPRGDRPPGE